MSILGGTNLPNWLLSNLESKYLRKDLIDIPKCDAVVALGSGHRFNSNGFLNIEFNGALDRIIVATEAMRLDKGDFLLLGGGYPSLKGEPHEGMLIKQWLVSWNVTEKPIIDLGVHRNTYDEATRVAKLAIDNGWNKIILVTSGYHLPRAVALFKKHNIEVIPVGADFIGLNSLKSGNNFNIIPNLGKFSHFNLFLHEIIGCLYYKIRGWI